MLSMLIAYIYIYIYIFLSHYIFLFKGPVWPEKDYNFQRLRRRLFRDPGVRVKRFLHFQGNRSSRVNLSIKAYIVLLLEETDKSWNVFFQLCHGRETTSIFEQLNHKNFIVLYWLFLTKKKTKYLRNNNLTPYKFNHNNAFKLNAFKLKHHTFFFYNDTCFYHSKKTLFWSLARKFVYSSLRILFCSPP